MPLLSGQDAAIEAYEAEVLAAFAQEREAVRSGVADGIGGPAHGMDVPSEMSPQIAPEVPMEPGAAAAGITKAQRDLALQLRLGF